MVQDKQTSTVNELPQPDKDAIAHSDKLKECLQNKILQAGGSVSFTDYMATVLYEPGLGYYSAGSTKLGEQGDFITAPEISSLFSKSIAQAILPALDGLQDKNILEVGAGSGVMAADILLHLQQLNKLPTRYYILELSADLRLRQQQTIKNKIPDSYDLVEWLDVIPENFNAVVIANELLDAMPVVRFRKEGQQVSIEHVINEDDLFASSYVACNADDSSRLNQRIIERVKKIEADTKPLNEGYISEINFNAEDWLESIAKNLNSGVIILIDYGYPQHEYYHAERNKGTLNCFYRHRQHDNPFLYPGLQDITAHVDFTAIADAALHNDLNVIGYTTQANFLFGAGIAQLAEDMVTVDEENALEQQTIIQQMALAGEVKKLTMPYEMGEIVKVIGLSKNCDITLDAFSFNDMRDHL